MANALNMPGAAIARRLRGHFAARRDAKHLRMLEPHLLRDIGLNPDEIHGIDLHSEAAHRLIGAR